MKLHTIRVCVFHESTKTGKPAKWGAKVYLECDVEANTKKEAKEIVDTRVSNEDWSGMRVVGVSMMSWIVE